MRFFKFLLLAAVGCALSMALAFAMTQYLMRNDNFLGGGKGDAAESAAVLRSHGNELLDLAEQLETHVGAPDTARQAAPWVRNVYLPRIERAHTALQAATDLPPGPLLQLQEAAYLLRKCADEPLNTELRERAVGQARRAYVEIDRYVALMGLERVSQPRRRLSRAFNSALPQTFANKHVTIFTEPRVRHARESL